MNKSSTGNLILAVRTLLSVLILLTVIPLAFATEETVSLSFKKTASATEKENFYTVKKGECLFGIIRKELGVSPKEISRTLHKIKTLNPHIKNIHVLYEGQKILLPKARTSSGKGIPDQNRKAQKKSQSATVVTADKNFLKYTVKKGDGLYQIIRKEVTASPRELHTTLKKIKKLNPHIRNINIIRPGDTLILPIQKGRMSVAKESIPQEKALPLPSQPPLSVEQKLAVIGAVVGRMNGSIIKEGTFYIPLLPAGQASINCAEVPIVEFNEGPTVFLDLSNRVPETLKSIIESTWKNYVFIRGGQNSTFPSLLESIIRSSPLYTLNSAGEHTTIGNNPKITIFVDWIISHRNGTDSFAIRFLRDRSSALHKNVKDYAKEKGFENIEILRAGGLVETEETSPSMELPVITNYETKPQLAASVLSTMGYVFTRDFDISIFDMGKDGFNVSIKADFRLAVNGKEILIVFKKIPKKFLDILNGRGITVITLSEDMEESTIVKGILGAIGIPFSRGSFSFPSASERMEICLPAIKAQPRGDLLYLVDYDIDSKIYGLLHEKWKVKAVRY